MAETFEPLVDKFLNGEIKSLVVVCPENERPLLGMGGFIDHKLKRPISQGLLAGFIKGTPGECTYVPVKIENKEYSLFVLGCGPVKKEGTRPRPTAQALVNLVRNLKSMKTFPVGVSKTDFSELTQAEFDRVFKDLDVVTET